MLTWRIVPIVVIALAGCASKPEVAPVAEEKPFIPSQDPVLIALASSAKQIDTSVAELNQVMAASRLPKISRQQMEQIEAANATVPEGLEALLTVRYNGPVVAFLKELCKQVRWTWGGDLGEKPPMEIIISKQYRDVPAVTVLQDIGYSISGATVVVDAKRKTITLRYK